MRTSRWFVALLLPLLFLLMGARAAPLVNPDPIAVPAGLSADVVQREIKRALISRKWSITGEKPGHIDATLNLRAHVARIAIEHGEGTVRVSYVSSENLNYEEKKGQRYIHKNYGAWVNNVVSDISANLQLESLN